MLIEQITEAEKLVKQYNKDENRDRDGKWTTGNDAQTSTVNAATATTGAIAIGTSSELGEGTLDNITPIRTIFGALGAASSEALAALGATFAAGAGVFTGAYFIPFGRSAVASGTLPGHPNLHYHYDGDEGHFSLYNADNELLFSGSAGGDGLIRTQDGDVIGRRVDGTVVLDSSIIPDDETETESSVQSQAPADTTTSDPNLCPVPLPDRPGFKSSASQAYQSFISSIVNPEHPMPPGWLRTTLMPLQGEWLL